MTQNNISDLKPGDKKKILEVKVYRKWISRNPPKPQATGYCCILIDKEGAAIQANMDANDINHFQPLLKVGSAYRISNFSCIPIPTNNWQQTIDIDISLRFGRITNCESIPSAKFPNHYFNFTSYNQLEYKITPPEPGSKRKHHVLTDYIGCVRRVSDLKIYGNPNTNQVVLKKIDIENLNGNIVVFTMWDDMARNFDKDALDLLEKPVIIAVTSCRVSKYTDIQLNATPATQYYLNPDIPEAEQSRIQYKQRYDQLPPLEVQKERYEDPEKEKTRNRYPLSLLLQHNNDGCRAVRFTCEGTISNINTTRDWYYASCTNCPKKIRYDNGKPECEDHGPQPETNYRYNFKASITDNSATATFTFFTPNADTIVGHDCNELIKRHNMTSPAEFPPEILDLEGKSHIFQFHYNPTPRHGIIDFFFDKILDTPTEIEQVSESQESKEGTSQIAQLQYPSETEKSLGITTPLQLEYPAKTHKQQLETQHPTETKAIITGTSTPSSPKALETTRTEKSKSGGKATRITAKRSLFQERSPEPKKKKTE